MSRISPEAQAQRMQQQQQPADYRNGSNLEIAFYEPAATVAAAARGKVELIATRSSGVANRELTFLSY